MSAIDLGKSSLVAMPANPNAKVTAVKSASISSIAALETALRDQLGLSKRDARKIAVGGWPALENAKPEVDADVAAALKAQITKSLQRSIEPSRSTHQNENYWSFDNRR